MDLVTCTQCLVSKPRGQFYAKGNGIRSKCKSCESTYRKQYREKTKTIQYPKQLARHKKWRDTWTPEQKARQAESQKTRYRSLSPEQKQDRLRKAKEYRDSERGWYVALANDLKRNFQISILQLATMYFAQWWRCAGCKSPLTGRLTPARKGCAMDNIDHDHATGQVRGILCRGCNNALGCVRDSPQTMLRLIDYLSIRRNA